MNNDMIHQLREKLSDKVVSQIASLTIHFTENCNLNCEHCSYAVQKKSIEIDMDLVDEIASKNPMYTCVVGGGEPTFLKDGNKFSRIMSRFHDGRCYIITNGIIIPKHQQNWAKKFDFYRISLDAASRSTYKRIKGMDCYNKVVSNIEAVLRNGMKKVGVSFVVQKNNYLDTFDFLKNMSQYFLKYGFRFFAKIKPLRGYKELLPVKKELDEIYAAIKNEASESILFARFLEEATNFSELPGMYIPIENNDPISRRCYYSLLYILINCEGDVYPCGLMSRKQENCLGNLCIDSWTVILKRQMEFFRSLEPKTEKTCKGCWDDDKNRILHEIVTHNVAIHPDLTKLGGISTIYCRY